MAQLHAVTYFLCLLFLPKSARPVLVSDESILIFENGQINLKSIKQDLALRFDGILP